MRLLGQPSRDRALSYAGTHYDVKGASAGPAPAHAISIWVGAVGPKMLQLTAELSDGWFAPLAAYVPSHQAAEANQAIDAAARAAGRGRGAIRRIYNVPGVVLRQEPGAMRADRPGVTVGAP